MRQKIHFYLVLKENPNDETSLFHLKALKILQNETKIIKIRQAVLKIFNLKSRFRHFSEKNRQKNRKCCFSEVLQKLKNNGLCDVRNDNAQLNI